MKNISPTRLKYKKGKISSAHNSVVKIITALRLFAVDVHAISDRGCCFVRHPDGNLERVVK